MNKFVGRSVKIDGSQSSCNGGKIEENRVKVLQTDI